MKPNEYNYRIVYKDGTFYILIDKKSSNINVLQIKKKLEKIVKKYKLPYNTDNVKIYVAGQLLTGAGEFEIKTLFFGAEAGGSIDYEQPVYKLCGDKNSDNQMLRVYFKGNALSICNYSANEESLGIKLDFKSKEAALIVKAEQYAKEQKEKQSSQSTSGQMLTPLLKGDKITCMHGGEVMLVSQEGEPFCNDSDSFVLGNDLLQASITGCNNNILGIPKPCTKIVLIPPTALSITKFNNQGVVIQEHLQTIMTDNMVGLMLKQAVEPNLWEVLSHQPSTNNGEAEGVLSELIPGVLYLEYNNINSGKVCIINTTFENMSNASYANTFSLDELSLDNPLDIEFEKPEESDNSIDSSILEEFKSLKSNTDDYIYKALTVIVDNNIYEYILVIPKAKKSLLKKLPKEYRDYGYGKITNLSYIKKRAISSSNGNKYNIGFSNISTIFLRFSAGAKKVLLHIESTSSLVNKSQTKPQNQNNQNNQMVCKYMSNEDFSNQYAKVFTSYNILYDPIGDDYSYQFIDKLVCKDNEKVEYSLGIEYSSSSEDNKENISNTNTNIMQQDKEKEAMAEALYEILSSNNISDIVDECVNTYQNFLYSLEDKECITTNSSTVSSNEGSKYYGGLKLDNLTEILNKAIRSRNEIYKDRDKYNQELKDVSENLLLKLIARKILELIKDNIIPFAAAKKKGDFVKETLKKVKFLVKHVPIIGIIIIVSEIALAILELIKEYENAPKLMSEFCNVLSFYSNLDAELSTILTSNNIGRDVFYKKHSDNGYFLALYNSFQENTKHLALLHNNLQTPCNYVMVGIDEAVYENNILSASQQQDDEESPVYNTANNIAQLSTFNADLGLKQSSYFHHVKDLVMKSNAFTMIESASFSSIFISELIKQGFYSSLGEKINKNVVIITDGIEKHNLVYKSQNYVFSKLLTDKETPHIYSFRLMKEYKISDFKKYVLKEIQALISCFIDGLEGIKLEKNTSYMKPYKKDVEIYLNALYNVYIRHFGILYGMLTNRKRNYTYNTFHAKMYQYFHLPYSTDAECNNKAWFSYDLITRFKSICERYKEHMEKVYKNNSTWLHTLKRYENYDFSFSEALNNVNKAIPRFHSLVDMMYRVLTYFNEEVSDKDVKENVDDTIEYLHKDIDSFFKITKDTSKFEGINVSSPLLQFIRSDSDLCKICKNVISAEYSYEYTTYKLKLRDSIMSYAELSGGHINFHSRQLALYVDNLYELFTTISDIINRYSFEHIVNNKKVLYVIKHDLYNIDKNIFKDIFYSSIEKHMYNILPIKKGSIEFAADDIRYYDLLQESILSKYLNTINQQSANKNNSTSLESSIFLSSYMFVQTLDNMHFNSNLDEKEKYEYAKILRVAYLLISDDINENLANINAEKAEAIKQSTASKAADRAVMEKIQIENPIDVIDTSLSIVSQSVENLLDDSSYVYDVLQGSLDGDAAKEAAKGIKNAATDLSNIISIVDDFSFENVLKVTADTAFEKLTDDDVMEAYEDPDVLSHHPVTKSFKNYKIYLKNCFQMENLKSALKATFSVKNINISWAAFVAQAGIDYVYELFAEKFLPVPDLEEFEAKTNAIKYAYTSKRVDSKGAVYNPSRDMIALPVKITQNYLMSDFKAALIGGASFDNDSFVRGTSAGIFIQDNDKIAQNVVHKLCDYIYNVPLDKIDPKNSIYIEAYKKIIRYLYNIDSSITKINDLYNNIGTSLLSDYGIVVLSPDMINNSENNEHYNINAQDEKYIQVSYIDDFAIQLKRFGEYNYKYFYSHQELISEGNGSSNGCKLKNNKTKKDKVFPILLGSLVYDKEWIDNKMEVN